MPRSDHPLAALLRRLEPWSALDADEQQAVLALPHNLASIGRGNYLVREGDKPNRACLLLSGFAYRHKIVGDGGRQILSIHMAGDVVDLQNSLLCVADHNVQAITNCQVAWIPIEAIRQLVRDWPSVGLALWHLTLIDGSIHREWIANVGRRDARTRMSHLLCEIGMRLREAGLASLCQYEIPLNQEELADALGLTAVHVNRTLKELDRSGVTTRDRRSVTIRDWQRLVHEGDFNPVYLHLIDGQVNEAGA